MPPAEVDGVWVFQRACGTKGASGAPRCSPGWTATAAASIPRATCCSVKGKERGQVRGVRRGGRERARSKRSPSCCRTRSTRIDDEQPPVAGAARELVRGRARCPASLAARARPSSTASAATSASTASRSPASATSSPRPCFSPTITRRSTPSARVLKERGERVGTATVYRTLEVLVESGLVRAHDFGEGFKRYEPMPAAGRPRAPDLRALRARGRVPERAARAHAADHRRRARLPAPAAPGRDLRRLPRVPAAGARQRCDTSLPPSGCWSRSPRACSASSRPACCRWCPSYIGFLTGMSRRDGQSAAGGAGPRAALRAGLLAGLHAARRQRHRARAGRSTITRCGSSASAAC